MSKVIEGVLVYNRIEDRYQIRYGIEEFTSCFHCGDTLQAMGTGGEWVDTRMEYDHDERAWYLVGFHRGYILDGTKVRY